MIGAAALACHMEMGWRRTFDLDTAVAIEAEDQQGFLAQLPGWRQDDRIEHRRRRRAT